jgi:hypothetical protein
MTINLPILLSKTRMHSNTGKVALSQKLVELRATSRTLDENDDLIELELIEQLVELTVLFILAETDKVLLQTVKGQLGVIVNIQFEWILHELFADWTSSGRQCSAEHHDLLLGWSGAEDFLDIAAHV